MTDDELQQRIAELDLAVPEVGANVVFFLERPDEQVCELIANRAGYLRLGIEMLKAATVPLEPGATFTPVRLDYLLANRSLLIRRVTRDEDVESALPPLTSRKSLRDKFAIGGCLVVFAFLAVCLIVGVFVVIAWVVK